MCKTCDDTRLITNVHGYGIWEHMSTKSYMFAQQTVACWMGQT